MANSRKSIGTQLRTLRQTVGLSLADVAARTDVSEATMSRIETGRSEVSAPHLYRLASLFGVDVGQFFGGQDLSNARAIQRKGEGQAFDTPRLHATLLCTDLRHKRMHPFLNRVTETSLEAVGGLSSHDGEEFLMVQSGALYLYSEAYAPLLLNAGDSLYFDATQPHAYVAAGDEGAVFLVVCTSDMNGNPKDTHYDR